MKHLLIHLRAVLRAVELPAEAGPLPLATGAMLGNEWLAPHLARLHRPMGLRSAPPQARTSRAVATSAVDLPALR